MCDGYPMRRIAVSALLCAGVLAGCYGSTEPATEVAFDSAKLNGRGTADKGPAFSYFEYAPTSTGFPGSDHDEARVAWRTPAAP